MDIGEVESFIMVRKPCEDGKKTLALVKEGVEHLACGDDVSALELFREAFSLGNTAATKQRRKWLAYLSEKNTRQARQSAAANARH